MNVAWKMRDAMIEGMVEKWSLPVVFEDQLDFTVTHCAELRGEGFN